MSLAIALRLGRISNLPTVWSNVLAGTVLAGASPWSATTLQVAVAVSLIYIGGMYLNDAFDRDIDAKERAERPIPAGRVSANTVFAAGFGLLLAGIAVTAALPDYRSRAVLSAAALAGVVVYYDWHHKQNAFSPVLMGLCRMLAYLTAGYAATALPTFDLFIAALVALSYLIGLTYTAKQEAFDKIDRLWPLLFLAAPLLYGVARWAEAPLLASLLLASLAALIGLALYFLQRRKPGDVPRTVVSLIAGISLVDALFLALAGNTIASAVAVGCFLATLALQRWISGT